MPRKAKPLAPCSCIACNSSFIPIRGSKGAFCSKPCMQKHRRDSRPEWLSCCRCLSAVGIGMAVQARILGTTKPRIHRARKLEGIKTALPQSGSWRLHAQRETSPVCGWWGNAETAALWMTQHRASFPDWSSLFRPKMSPENKQKANAKYHAMTDEEKKERNRRCQELRKIRHESNPEIKKRDRERVEAWRTRNPEKARASSRASSKRSIAKRKIADPGFKAQCNLRHRLKQIMGRVKMGGTEHINNLTGCSTSQLAKHLESTFKKGMTWQNYGTRWHVDHIIPCAAFDHTDPKQRAQCWHWTNLRALDAKKNMEKRDSITEPQMSLLLCATH